MAVRFAEVQEEAAGVFWAAHRQDRRAAADGGDVGAVGLVMTMLLSITHAHTDAHAHAQAEAAEKDGAVAVASCASGAGADERGGEAGAEQGDLSGALQRQ
eukprot:2532356-Rhodomonas_salina.3